MIKCILKTKNDNRGFSLVELIIVISIMAILIAVMAPMFIRYVERSRIAVDVNAVGSMARALKAVATDAAVISTGEAIELVWETGKGGIITVNILEIDFSLYPADGSVKSRTQNTDYQNSLTELIGTAVEAKSSTLSGDSNTKVTITVADTGTGIADAAVIGAVALPTGDYANYFYDQIKGIN